MHTTTLWVFSPCASLELHTSSDSRGSFVNAALNYITWNDTVTIQISKTIKIKMMFKNVAETQPCRSDVKSPSFSSSHCKSIYSAQSRTNLPRLQPKIFRMQNEVHKTIPLQCTVISESLCALQDTHLQAYLPLGCCHTHCVVESLEATHSTFWLLRTDLVFIVLSDLTNEAPFKKQFCDIIESYLMLSLTYDR